MKSQGRPLPLRARPHSEHVSALANGLSCLATFHAQARDLTIAELASLTGLSRASARRVLLTLADLGYVAQNGRCFGLTPKVVDLGIRYDGGNRLAQIMRPVCASLVDRLHETASVGVLHGDAVQYVVRVRPPRPLHLAIDEGDRLPAHAVSAGRVLLAMQPAQEVEGYLRTTAFTQRTRTSIRSAEVMREELGTIAHQGFALVLGEYDETIGGLAVPLRDGAGHLHGAISVSASLARHDRDSFLTIIKPALEAARDAFANERGDRLPEALCSRARNGALL